MADCEKHIKNAAKAVEPTRHQKDRASRSHNHLRSVLQTGNFQRKVIDSYLSGSYARDTAIGPLEDVDIIFLINPSAWERPLFADYPSPDTVLQSFARAVRYRYGSSSVRVQRRSICLQMNHIDIDVVPAVDAGNGLIMIPDRDQDGWIRSGPKIHADYSSQVNKSNDGRLKPTIKLLKHWNSQLPSTAYIKSFALETMATRLFEKAQPSSFQQGLLAFFDHVAHLGKQSAHFKNWDRLNISTSLHPPRLSDAAGLSNLLERIDSQRRERFVENAIRSRNKMLDALEAARSETAWRRVSEALRIDECCGT